MQKRNKASAHATVTIGINNEAYEANTSYVPYSSAVNHLLNKGINKNPKALFSIVHMERRVVFFTKSVFLLSTIISASILKERDNFVYPCI